MILTQEHKELQRTVRNFVENEINPNVEQWEKDGIFPAKELFKKMVGVAETFCKELEEKVKEVLRES